MAQSARLTRMATDDTHDGGKPRVLPQRRCIVTHAVMPAENLLRFVADPQGVLTPDLKAILPGRGAWVYATQAALEKAMKQKAFDRALGQSLVLPASLVSDVDTLLYQRAVAALSLARKAGAAVAGFMKVHEALGRGCAALLHAPDAAAEGRGKLDRLYRAQAGAGAFIFNFIKNDDLDMAFSREHVIHALIRDGEAGRAALRRLRAVVLFRQGGLSGENEQKRNAYDG